MSKLSDQTGFEIDRQPEEMGEVLCRQDEPDASFSFLWDEVGLLKLPPAVRICGYFESLVRSADKNVLLTFWRCNVPASDHGGILHPKVPLTDAELRQMGRAALAVDADVARALSTWYEQRKEPARASKLLRKHGLDRTGIALTRHRALAEASLDPDGVLRLIADILRLQRLDEAGVAARVQELFQRLGIDQESVDRRTAALFQQHGIDEKLHSE